MADRFAFGENWRRFLEVVDEERVGAAAKHLCEMLPPGSLAGKTFLDVGCGSGLSSLAALRLGARVTSFDFDPDAVACTRELKRRFSAPDAPWDIREGSVLDVGFLSSLGRFDVVNSWGVLHHTGRMWQAFENVAPLVAGAGILYLAIYNDQGGASRRWRAVKKLYSRLPGPGRLALVVAAGGYFTARGAAVRLLRLQNPLPFREWADRKRERGMSWWHDLVDWVGGWPFEVAKPEEVFAFFHDRNFALERLKTCGGGLACNEFVFVNGGRAAQRTSQEDVIRRLDLAPHPEGGWYREVHRSAAPLGTPPGYPGARSALTAIYFLLPEDGFSAFHRVRSEEAWVHLDGAPIELATLGAGAFVRTLAPAAAGGEPLAVVPPGLLQAARAVGGWALAACLVAPGFDFADFEMPPRDELLARHPELRELILRFTRPDRS